MYEKLTNKQPKEAKSWFEFSSSSFDDGNNEEDLLSPNLDCVLDNTDGDAQSGLSSDSDECSI